MRQAPRATTTAAVLASIALAVAGCGRSDSNAPSPAHGEGQHGAASHASPSEPSPASSTSVAGDAVAWQLDQLRDGVVTNVQYGTPDVGLTIDTAIMLTDRGGRSAALAQIRQGIRANAAAYISFQGNYFAGSTAKQLYATEVLDMPRTVSGVDLRRQLLGLLHRDGPDAGRFSDQGKQDYSNTTSQAYAVLALSRTGAVPQPAVDHLLEQQCTDGGFSDTLVTGQTCDQAGSAANVDATAISVQALAAASDAGADVPPGTTKEAAAWLLDEQSPEGSFSTGTGPANTNSTGLAASALAVTGHQQQAARSARWVASMAVTAGPDAGAIAFTAEDLDRAEQSGVTDRSRDSFLRATPQALMALDPVDLGTLTAR